MLRLSLLIAALFLSASAAVAQDFAGRMSFHDADTMTVAGRKVRLFGIDAPELSQTCTRFDGATWNCGAWATREAKRRFQGLRAECRDRGADRYGRTIATCTQGGKDIAAILVAAGAAAAYSRYSRDYIDVEKAASVARKGIWSGPFQRPEEFRHDGPPQTASTPGRCAIKGNISSGGRIYHLPGQENYAKTLINTARGERWFCTEAEARNAGWRRARR